MYNRDGVMMEGSIAGGIIVGVMNETNSGTVQCIPDDVGNVCHF